MTLEILTSDDLAPFRHGFFTRRGGVSSGIFSGLNCGPGSSDQTDAVQVNRRLVCDTMNVAPQNLATVHQTHSADVLVVDGPITDPRPKCDAMVTATPGVALGILTADCQPVLFADRTTGIVGAAHAGWKGALDGVLEATVDAMVDLGAERTQIAAVIGPCISQKAYEVGPEFRQRFITRELGNDQFFEPASGGKFLFDLPAFGLENLARMGIRSNIWTGNCTYSDPSRFFSYRRATHLNEPDYGRLIAVISAERV